MLRSMRSFFKDDSRVGKNRRWLLGIFLFCILAVAAVVIIPWVKTWQVLVSSDLTLIGIAFLLSLPYQLLTAQSYCVVANAQNVRLNFWHIFRINMIMQFYEVVLPSTFFVSGLRWYRYSQDSGKPGQSLTSIAYLKALNLVLSVLLAAGLLLFFDTTTLKGHALEIVLLLAAAGLILSLTPLLCRALIMRLPRPDDSPLRWAAARLVYRYGYKTLAAFANFQNLGFKTQTWLILISLAGQGMQYAAYLLFADSVGIQLTYAQLGALRALLILAANLPVNFSVGIGLREVTLVSVLAAMGVPLETAAAMAVVVLARTFFYAVFGGVLEILRLAADRKSETSPER